MQYYKNALCKLGQLKEGDSIQIKFEGKKTNFFALNNESIKALKNWIETIEATNNL